MLPAGIPANARFKEARRNEVCVQGEFFYDGRRAQVAWSRAGDILSERYFDRHGRAHGIEVSRFDDGSVEWQVAWVRGQMHGLARQFDVRGRELSRSRFIRGAGIDIWIDNCVVTEIRELRNSVLHGVERWGLPDYPSEEGHYLHGKRSGIFRRWKDARLETGCPQYFLDDVEVDRAQYRRARRRNSALPPDLRKDDRRERRPPKGLKAVWLRREVGRSRRDVSAGCGE